MCRRRDVRDECSQTAVPSAYDYLSWVLCLGHENTLRRNRRDNVSREGPIACGESQVAANRFRTRVTRLERAGRANRTVVVETNIGKIEAGCVPVGAPD